jgi:hypothetical protein
MRSSGVVEGPEMVAAEPRSYTGGYLKPMLSRASGLTRELFVAT